MLSASKPKRRHIDFAFASKIRFAASFTDADINASAVMNAFYPPFWRGTGHFRIFSHVIFIDFG
jgi:hypothetical protein